MIKILKRNGLKFIWIIPILLIACFFLLAGTQIKDVTEFNQQPTNLQQNNKNSVTEDLQLVVAAPDQVAVKEPGQVLVTPPREVVVTATRPSTSTKPKCTPQKSFVFIKTHKSGSTTMIAPFQKYAYLNNLTMMVPALDNNIHLSWPFQFIPQASHMIAPFGGKFQALVNHIVYNKQAIRPLMEPSTKYVTIVRAPAPHLISAFQYFSVNKDNLFLRLELADFERFLSDPVKYDPIPPWMVNMKNTRVKSMTRNLQSADLGLFYTDFDNMTAVQAFVKEIEEDFSFVLVLERLSESLILLKRKFCWTLQDILHINKNVQKTQWHWNYRNISQSSMPAIAQWNNADSLLYTMATTKLDEMKALESDVDEEVKVYDEINTKVTLYCGYGIQRWNTSALPEPLVIEKTKFNERFEVDRGFCVLLLIKEEDFTLLHKCRLYPQYPQCIRNSNVLLSYGKLIHGDAYTLPPAI